MLLIISLLHPLSWLFVTGPEMASTAFGSATAKHLGLAATSPAVTHAPSDLDGSLNPLQLIQNDLSQHQVF